MEAKTNYTLVGIVVLVLLIGLLSTGLWLSVGFNEKTYTTYTVFLHEPASGLSEQAPVKFNGVPIGFVKQIRLNKNDPRQVELVLSIEEGTPITTSTTATLVSQGITGVTHVGLSAGSADLTPLRRMSGEPYPVIPAKPSLFNQLDSLLKEVSQEVRDLSVQAQHIFNDKNARYIRQILANVDKTTTVVAKNSDKINNGLKNLDVFLANMAHVSKDFPHISQKLQTALTKFSDAGSSVSKTMQSGRNTIDKLSQETIPPAVVLLRRLNAVSANLEKVSNEMRQNPAVVIRGAAAPKPGPGE